MSAGSALSNLAEKLAVFSSEYRSLLKRCAALEDKVAELASSIDKMNDTGKPVRAEQAVDSSETAMGAVKAKLEEMLSELDGIS